MAIDVIAMRVMQVAIHQVIHVIAVRNSLMAAILAMHMLCLMASATLLGIAFVRISIGDLYRMVVVAMPFMRMMQMAILKIVRVITMLDGRMPASRPVHVIVVVVVMMCHVSVLQLPEMKLPAWYENTSLRIHIQSSCAGR